MRITGESERCVGGPMSTAEEVQLQRHEANDVMVAVFVTIATVRAALPTAVGWLVRRR